jgi:hypothetical protein
MNDLVITLVGLAGLSALAMSYNSEETKENFGGGGGMPQGSSYMQKVLVTSNGKMGAGGAGSGMKMTSVNQSEYPMLGSSATTSMPYVATPTYQQSTPLRSPNIALPPMIRYKPPTLDQMGITDKYMCPNGNNQPIKEKYMNIPPNNAGGFMGMKIDPANPNPAFNSQAGTYGSYAASNYNEASGTKSCMDSSIIDGIPAGQIDMMSASGDSQNVMVFERPMTTTMKYGRLAYGLDPIRGEIPIEPNRPQIFSNTPANPALLRSGALSVMSGVNEANTLGHAMAKRYGSTSSIYGGVNMSGQQYTPMDLLQAGSGINQNTPTVLAFP